jgi:hypothetical protein
VFFKRLQGKNVTSALSMGRISQFFLKEPAYEFCDNRSKTLELL